MKLDLSGKHVLVTGASQGIGRAIALGFAAEGACVSVAARRAPPLSALVAEMGGEKAGHGFCAIDLMLPDGPGRFVDEAVRRRGPVSIVVHNIGGTMGNADTLPSADEAARVWRDLVKSGAVPASPALQLWAGIEQSGFDGKV